jgi:signal transduction histidine kinase
MSALAWLTLRTQKQYLLASRIDEVHAVGATLARAADTMLGGDELSSARLLVADAAANYDFARCRILLSDGRVVADAEPSQITLSKLPPKWNDAKAAGERVESQESTITATFPIHAAGRGAATLEITAKANYPFLLLWKAQAGVGTVGAAAMGLLLLVYRRARLRLRAMGAIRDSLLALQAGETCEDVLAIQDTLGLEAQAWNKLLGERQNEQRKAGAQRAMEIIGSRKSAKGDLDAAFDAMAHGMLLVDDKLQVKHCNGAAAAFLRGKRELIVGTDVTRIIDQPDVLESIRAVTGGTTRRKASVEVERQGDRDAGVLRFSIRPVRREDSASAMVIIEDITQQKVADESRNAFVAHATHELRTPLTNIRLYLETAMEDGESDPAVRGKCLNVINQEARRLERIVGEMLSVSEIEAGSLRLKYDDVRLDALFDELRADYLPQADEKTIKLEFKLPVKLPVIHGDRDKILLALHNLVGNALKYTPSGGSVTVNVDVDASQLVFAVSDTGFGVSEEETERIFERFYRAKDPRVEKLTGTGLGLTLAREVVRLHGGDVTLKSELNKGSTFTLTLPVSAEAA